MYQGTATPINHPLRRTLVLKQITEQYWMIYKTEILVLIEPIHLVLLSLQFSRFVKTLLSPSLPAHLLVGVGVQAIR